MSGILTNWGYTLTELEALPDFLTVLEFDAYTAGKYRGDVRAESMIGSASAAIRDYIGWHLYPSAACRMSERLHFADGRIKRVGRDLLVQLPARYVTAVESALIDGTEHTDLSFEPTGLLYLYDVGFCGLSRKTQITVSYTAGLPESELDAVKELVAHRVTHALAVPAGITSEAAGGVSVTYNAAWANSARATALPDDNKQVLAPYRLQGVF